MPEKILINKINLPFSTFSISRKSSQVAENRFNFFIVNQTNFYNENYHYGVDKQRFKGRSVKSFLEKVISVRRCCHYNLL